MMNNNKDSRSSVTAKRFKKAKTSAVQQEPQFAKAEVGHSGNAQTQVEAYRNILREVGSIKKRVNNVLTDYDEFCEHKSRRTDDIDENNVERLLQNYESTQRERDLILQSLKAFFKNHISYFKDLSLPSAVDTPDLQLLDLDIDEERFMNAWRVVLSDINKLSEISKQLVGMGKLINKLPILIKGDSSVEKSQVDHLRDIFTKEAMQNLRITRQLQEMNKEVAALREQNKELLSKKGNGDNRPALQMHNSLEQAYAKIQQLQSEIADSKEKEKVAVSAAFASPPKRNEGCIPHEQKTDDVAARRTLKIPDSYTVENQENKSEKETTDNVSIAPTLVKNDAKEPEPLSSGKEETKKQQVKEVTHACRPKLLRRSVQEKPIQKKSKSKPENLLKMSKIDFSSVFMPITPELAPPVTAVKSPRYFTPAGYKGRIPSAVASPAPLHIGNPSSSPLSIQESSISASVSPFLPPIEAPPVLVHEREEPKLEEKESETRKLEKIKSSYKPLSANKTFMHRHRSHWKPILAAVNKQETIQEDPTVTSIQFLGPDDGTRTVGAAKYNRPAWVRKQGSNNGSKRSNCGSLSMAVQGKRLTDQRAITEGRRAEQPYRSRLPMEASGGQQGDRPGASRQAMGHQPQTVQRSVRNQHNPQTLQLHYINFSDVL
ncbi:PREDICTED: uncharacterized protein LOC100636780 [Amphimedon queenslandica]|uniref:Uncharacterized protein n=1 Tax=Amphimedon queenslandica TaxID=400682 RepID=A0AAN0IV04_AMPQE|nr:PREDICTED: uncharacterized protein LOC100636780 [Amphimedon queenslandica]|eukprot:XP_011410490.1 PREDICTED: uncharacterized protein LOC100636780 [Amphimedon queenslandica]